MPYDPSNEQGKVRLLISDVGGADGESFLFTDTEIQTFLELEGSIRLAAASALRTIAGNEAQVSKRITFLELKTDGPSVSKELRELADKLESREDDDTVMDFAQIGVDVFSRRELHDQYARKQVG
jgi:hypothetical protein